MELDFHIKPESPVRQGDVFGLRDWDARSPMDRFGVVITADCDLVRARPDTNLIYLSIVTLEDYVDQIWCPKEADRKRELYIRTLTELINRVRRSANSIVADLTAEQVQVWVETNSVEAVLSSIGPVSQDELAKCRQQIDRYRTIRDIFCDSQTKWLEKLARVEALMTSKLFERCREDIVRRARTVAGARERDDTFFISGIRDMDDKTGYLVLLDHVNAIRMKEITSSFSEFQRDHGPGAYRFGALSSLYKYALAQQFAFLFQRIGLPDIHGERQKAVAQTLFSD